MKATWAWVKGESKEAMKEVLGARRDVQAGEVETPRWRQGRDERRRREQRATRRATAATG
jgi:hypothetical protein